MRTCSFCGRSESECKELFSGIRGELICGECIRSMNDELRSGASYGYIKLTTKEQCTLIVTGYVSSEGSYDFGGVYVR